MTELYSLRSSPNPPGNRYTVYEFRKFDGDYNCLATYLTSAAQCNCPRGETGKRCRHQEMLNTLIPKVDSGWFYNRHTQQWHKPFGHTDLMISPEAIDEALESDEGSEGECADRSSASAAPEVTTPPTGTSPAPPSPVSRYLRR